jgi:hypothetical protein
MPWPAAVPDPTIERTETPAVEVDDVRFANWALWLSYAAATVMILSDDSC